MVIIDVNFEVNHQLFLIKMVLEHQTMDYKTNRLKILISITKPMFKPTINPIIKSFQIRLIVVQVEI